LIKVGDRITNCDNVKATITQVEVGQYGLLVTGLFFDGLEFESYLPYELPPTENQRGWYGWGRAEVTLLSGIKLGVVGIRRGDPKVGKIEEYEAEWERTITQIAKERSEEECIV